MTFKHEAHSYLIYCVDGSYALSSSRLFSSTNFFTNDRKLKNLGIGKNPKGVIAYTMVEAIQKRWGSRSYFKTGAVERSGFLSSR